MKKLFLLLILAAPTWAVIASPKKDAVVSGIVSLQVQNPVGNPNSINAQMKLVIVDGPDKVVWKGKLNQAEKYTTQINTAGFAPGQYDIETSYSVSGKKYDETVKVSIK